MPSGSRRLSGRLQRIHLLDRDHAVVSRLVRIAGAGIAERVVDVVVAGRARGPEMRVLEHADVGHEEPALVSRQPDAERIAADAHLSDDGGEVVRLGDLPCASLPSRSWRCPRRGPGICPGPRRTDTGRRRSGPCCRERALEAQRRRRRHGERPVSGCAAPFRLTDPMIEPAPRPPTQMFPFSPPEDRRAAVGREASRP